MIKQEYEKCKNKFLKGCYCIIQTQIRWKFVEIQADEQPLK